eukprot:458631_1
MSQRPRDKLKSLETQRKNLEIEIKDLLEQIPQEFRNVTKKPKYTDHEGYPRPDIDIWRIAEVRKKIVMLQNDHMGLMTQIEQLLMNVFSNKNANNSDQKQTDQKQIETDKSPSVIDKIATEKEKNDIISSMKAFISKAETEQRDEEEEQEDLNRLQPFYVIDRVFDHSPSHDAGAKCGDLIVKFGTKSTL